VDINYENVGGEILEEVLNRMNLHGRIVLCGLISGYTKESAGFSNLGMLIVKRLKIEGFLILDYTSRFTEGVMELGKWKMMGKLKDRQTVVEGLEKAPDAINMLFTGGNIGKLIVKL
jgi:NADPH-dependent curcumin reductase